MRWNNAALNADSECIFRLDSPADGIAKISCHFHSLLTFGFVIVSTVFWRVNAISHSARFFFIQTKVKFTLNSSQRTKVRAKVLS